MRLKIETYVICILFGVIKKRLFRSVGCLIQDFSGFFSLFKLHMCVWRCVLVLEETIAFGFSIKCASKTWGFYKITLQFYLIVKHSIRFFNIHTYKKKRFFNIHCKRTRIEAIKRRFLSKELNQFRNLSTNVAVDAK